MDREDEIKIVFHNKKSYVFQSCLNFQYIYNKITQIWAYTMEKINKNKIFIGGLLLLLVVLLFLFLKTSLEVQKQKNLLLDKKMEYLKIEKNFYIKQNASLIEKINYLKNKDLVLNTKKQKEVKVLNKIKVDKKDKLEKIKKDTSVVNQLNTFSKNIEDSAKLKDDSVYFHKDNLNEINFTFEENSYLKQEVKQYANILITSDSIYNNQISINTSKSVVIKNQESIISLHIDENNFLKNENTNLKKIQKKQKTINIIKNIAFFAGGSLIGVTSGFLISKFAY